MLTSTGVTAESFYTRKTNKQGHVSHTSLHEGLSEMASSCTITIRGYNLAYVITAAAGIYPPTRWGDHDTPSALYRWGVKNDDRKRSWNCTGGNDSTEWADHSWCRLHWHDVVTFLRRCSVKSMSNKNYIFHDQLSNLNEPNLKINLSLLLMWPFLLTVTVPHQRNHCHYPECNMAEHVTVHSVHQP